jgi:hypothetical protein
VFSSPVGGRVDSPRGGFGGGGILFSPASDLSSSTGGGEGLASPGPLVDSVNFSGLFGGPWGAPHTSGLSGHSELFTPDRPFAVDMSAAAATYAAALSGLMSRDSVTDAGGSPFPAFAGTLADPLSAASQQYLWSMYLDKPKSAL